jgi:hypothetical protein
MLKINSNTVGLNQRPYLAESDNRKGTHSSFYKWTFQVFWWCDMKSDIWVNIWSRISVQVALGISLVFRCMYLLSGGECRKRRLGSMGRTGKSTSNQWALIGMVYQAIINKLSQRRRILEWRRHKNPLSKWVAPRGTHLDLFALSRSGRLRFASTLPFISGQRPWVCRVMLRSSRPHYCFRLWNFVALPARSPTISQADHIYRLDIMGCYSDGASLKIS